MDPALLNIVVTAAVTLLSYWFAHRNGYQLPGINPAPANPPVPPQPAGPAHPVLNEALQVLAALLPKLQAAAQQPAPAAIVTQNVPVTAQLVVQHADPK